MILKGKTGYLCLLIVSIITLLSTFLCEKGKYPDWDDDIAMRMDYLIWIVLFITWIFAIICFLSSTRGRSEFWFKVGVSLSFVLSIVRLFFFSELFGISDLLK